jgi:hypothetical protein
MKIKKMRCKHDRNAMYVFKTLINIQNPMAAPVDTEQKKQARAE